MADVQVNSDANLRRFENGGVLKLTDTDDHIINNYEKGTLRFRPPKRAPLPRTDRSDLKKPLMGDMQAGELSFTIKAVKDSGATEIPVQMLEDPASPDGFVKEFTFKIEIPDYKGASTGVRAVLTVYVEEAPTRIAGNDYDLYECKFVVRDWTPWATY